MTETVDTGTGVVDVRKPDEVLKPGELPKDTVDKVNAFLSGAPVQGNDDPEAIRARIVAQVLGAESPQEVLASTEATGLREYLDEPFELQQVSFHESTYEEGMPFYTVLTGVEIDTGEKVVLTTGAQHVVAQVFRLAQRGWLPIKVVARKSKNPTKNGYWPIRLDEHKAEVTG